MSASAQMTEEMIVSNTVNIQSTKPAPWWQGLTLDQQDEWLDRIDPEQYGPGKQAPMSVRRWNREKKRIRRARERWIVQIASLRRPCHCKNCRKHRRPPFPKYYVVNCISYECWLEEQTIDPELEDDLARLRNDRKRAGAAFVRRLDVEYSPRAYGGGIWCRTMISPIRELSQETRDFVIALAAKGTHTQAEIAKMVGTTQSNISKLLARSRGHPPKRAHRKRAAKSDNEPSVFAVSQLGSRRLPFDLDFL